MDLRAALGWLDSHGDLEATPAALAQAPTLDRVVELAGLMGDPQRAYPVIHITGTNGKGSTARMVTALLTAANLSVGTYTGPHLQRVNERIAWNGAPIPDTDLAEVLSALADLEGLMAAPASRFELLTAGAFRWFADQAVDVAVVEVGSGGRWDATNVADGAVAVITNVELDHEGVLGPSRADIAAEKAGIVKPGSVLVLGETDPELAPVFDGAGADTVLRRGADWASSGNRVAHGGRLVDLRTPRATYPGVFLPLHGAHQGENAACALAAAEAFFGRPVPEPLVEEAFAAVRIPGRLEVVARHPLVVLDGAHNPSGARAAAAALDEEFGAGGGGRILVVGLLAGRGAGEMLAALGAGRARLVIATRAPSPRALPPEEVARAAGELGVEAVAVDDTAAAVARAVGAAGSEETVLVTGSLSAVGAARSALVG